MIAKGGAMTEIKSPFVSVVILNYNCRKFLGNCLSSALNTSYPNYEIILVDNNSNDGSVEFVLQKFNSNLIKVVKLTKNYGFAAGNNLGAKHANGDYMVFLNPDTEVDPDCLKNLVYALENNSSIGVAQPKLLLMNKKHACMHFDSAGGYINPYGLVWIRGAGEKDEGQYDEITEIFYAKGAALIIRRDLWDKLRGFDPAFFTYYDETDLCWRAWNMGYKVVYVPKAIVYHVGGGILKHVPYHLKFHEARGRLTILIKNYSLKNIFRYVPGVLLLHSFNVARQLAKGNGLASIAIVKGTLWCIFNFKRVWTVRKKAEKSLGETDRQRLLSDGKLFGFQGKIFDTLKQE